MTMDLYGQLIDQNLWDAAKRVDDVSGENTGISRPVHVAPDLHRSSLIWGPAQRLWWSATCGSVW